MRRRCTWRAPPTRSPAGPPPSSNTGSSPWSYDPPDVVRFGAGASDWVNGTPEPDGARYLALHHTALQIRFGTVFAFFVPGALHLVRRLPPVHGRLPATLPAVWTWGLVAGTLAVTVSAPWAIA
ncbi:hypothetical protein [Streptomyces sp. NPDC001292]|uniref:hypothetical protein n=1 Tax=Streptomyces sp. NPDC001292 TaxID=3364558 RepID=UPI0036B9830B